MNIEKTTLVETIAASVPGATGVFEAVGIDYACGARLSLREAAEIAGIDTRPLIDTLQSLPAATSDTDWNERSLTDVARQVTAGHHLLIREQLPHIALAMANLCMGAARSSDVMDLRAEIASLSGELIPHLHDEERNVFQVIEAMETAWQENETPPPLDHGLHKRIAELMVAHGSIAQRVHRIRDLRLRISTGADLSPECHAALALLEQFEAHLRHEMFIENCILFPRALALEEQWTAPVAAGQPSQ